ncbi:hypothetical protein Tph_c02770 [Thermacetogenium phaeum DSM 12270]|uniref:Uncharacterized protein n=1 Tax=Thermacetogenium phaeum (strain ATCC BAA-254 / DSM 26808 / PB) TaxID=1089553 RepID=K4LQZ8_THEPS|nr:hypothetical protein Tph_c02770 [Thermacetogenium phaeum DSM 12270]
MNVVLLGFYYIMLFYKSRYSELVLVFHMKKFLKSLV